MGNEQSTLNLNVTNAEIKVENGELNGHAVPTPDVTKPVASKEAAVEQKSETPPVTIPNEPKPPQKEEVDSSKLNGPAHVETTPEQTTVAKDAEPPKTNIFGKMFKKKSEHGKPDSVDAQVTAVDLKTDMLSEVFVNSDEKEILEEFAVKLKLQLVDSIPAQPESPSLLTKSISMESLSLKSKEPPTVEAKVPEDEEPKNVDAEQALLEDNEHIKIVESIISDKKGQLACEIVPVLSPVEEPVVGTEKLVAEEMADIVEEIFRITQKQETVSNVNEEFLRNNIKKTLVVAEEPLTASVEPALVAEEEMAPADEFVLSADSKAGVDEESWVVIEEPPQPLNVSAHSGRSKTKLSLTKSNPILSQLKLMCTKALEDASYKPLSVDVRAVSAIHITIEMSPEEFAYLSKVSSDKQCSFSENGTAWTNSQHTIHF